MQLGPLSLKGQAGKNLDLENLLKCEKTLPGGKQKFSRSILGKNVVWLVKQTVLLCCNVLISERFLARVSIGFMWQSFGSEGTARGGL